MDHAALDMDLEFSGIPLKGKTFAGILEDDDRLYGKNTERM